MFRLIFVAFILFFQSNSILLSTDSAPYPIAITELLSTDSAPYPIAITETNKKASFPLKINNTLDHSIELRINKSNEKFHGKLSKETRNRSKMIANFESGEFSQDTLSIRSNKSGRYRVEIADDDESNTGEDNILLNVYKKGENHKIADISVSKYKASFYPTEGYCGRVYRAEDLGDILVILGESEDSLDEGFDDERKESFGLPIPYKPI